MTARKVVPIRPATPRPTCVLRDRAGVCGQPASFRLVDHGAPTAEWSRRSQQEAGLPVQMTEACDMCEEHFAEFDEWPADERANTVARWRRIQ